MALDLAGPVPELVSDQNSATVRTVQYLKGFDALGEQIFYHKPATDEIPSDGPELVIIASWLYALPRHIAKYTAACQKVYPGTPILLLKQDGPDMMWRPKAWQMENMQPVIDVLSTVRSRSTTPKVLLHVFSNGGVFTACQLADAIKLKGTKTSSLPISALVIDSAPSIPSFSKGRVALSQGLPSSLPGPVRAIGGVALWSTMLSLSLISRVLGAEGTMTGARRKLNDPDGPFVKEDLVRMYVYSETDEIIPWQQVEEHAHEAKDVYNKHFGGSGDKHVLLEKFDGSKHVAHAVVDPERYWKVVKDLWLRNVEK